MNPEKKMNSITVSSLVKPLGKILKKFHLTIFFALVVGGLSVAVILLNQTLSEKADTSNYTTSISSSTIDRATLNKIQALKSSNSPAEPFVLPSGRTNPFGE